MLLQFGLALGLRVTSVLDVLVDVAEDRVSVGDGMGRLVDQWVLLWDVADVFEDLD